MLLYPTFRVIASALLVMAVLRPGELQCQEPPSPFGGRWVGGIEADGRWQFVTATFSAGEPITGRFALPLDGFAAACSTIEIQGSQIHCELGESRLVVAARITGDEIEGMVEAAGATGRLRLVRSLELAPGAVEEYAGAYRFADGGELLIDTSPEFPSTLLATDARTGEVRALHPLAEDRFFAGLALFVPIPAEQTVSFQRAGGLVSGVELARQDRPARRANRLPLRREEVRFSSGEISLAGTLLLPPEGAEPFPVIVFTHGGGPALREWFWGLGYLFAARGVAVLAYDKRGAGGSTGNWRDASFEELAGDAVAAAEYLQARGDIRPSGIGFWGISQGGWIAPLAATRFRQAAFVVALSGGGLSPAEQELLDTEFELRTAGMAPGVVEEALRFQRLRNQHALHGTSWNEYETALQHARRQPWFRFPGVDTWGPPTPEDPYWTRIRRFYFHDPAAALRSLRAPILALFGELDSPPAARVNADVMQRALAAAEHPDFTIRTVPRGRHNLMQVPDGSLAELARIQRFPPGLFEAMVEWVRARVQQPKP